MSLQTFAPTVTGQTATAGQATAGYIICGSHRARERTVGRNSGRQAYYFPLSYDGPDNKGGIYAVTAEELEQFLQVKGVRKLAAKHIPYLCKCW